MPRCQGLPDQPCPERKNDNTVRVGEGDLLLCHLCDKVRHKQWLESRANLSDDTVKAVNAPTEGRKCKTASRSASDSTSTLCSTASSNSDNNTEDVFIFSLLVHIAH